MARRRQARPTEDDDLFPLLIEDLAAALLDLPADAWTGQDEVGGGAVALSARLERLRAARAALREEDEERTTKRGAR
jgi:hypothetical protein